jgi:streptogramin lyase
MNIVTDKSKAVMRELNLMRQIYLVLILLLFTLSPAHACRPFGSYQFVEDSVGGVWFTEGDNNAVSHLAPDGRVTAHTLPTSQSEPASLALAPSGAVWYVALDVAKIGRIEPTGRIVEFPITDGHPGMVVVDRNGEAWFTQMAGNEDGRRHVGHGAQRIAKVGRINASGEIDTFPVPEGWPTSIAFDAQDRIWVTLLVPGTKMEKPKGRLVSLSRDGQWRIIARWENSCPHNLTQTPKGGLAFSDHCREVLGRVSAEGAIVSQALPPKTYIQQLSAAAKGTLWFTGDERGRLGRIDPHGKVSYVERPENGDQTMAILAARNGDILFSEFYNYNINRLKSSGEFVEHLINVDDRKQVRKITEGEVCRLEFAARIASKLEMDKRRAEEVRNGSFRADGKGTEKLVERKCLSCHDARRLLLSRRSDWTPSIERMRGYRELRDVEPLTDEESQRLVNYFNEFYGIDQ